MSATAFVVGTAGHIDHGKTALVRALTGIDTDRLKEEKLRGITIELGFAHLDLTGEGLGVVGVVDVPGHERFVRTMVAGAVGIDLVLLVVAADEGVMPQTREHLDICQLLGIRRGLVALTKCDLVEQELRLLAEADVTEALKGTFLEEAPIVPCSATTGEGLPELRRALADALAQAPARNADGWLRLPLDRVFSMKGFGTVVTGTLWSGRIRPEMDVVVLPGGAQAKVRGVQVHGVQVDEARAGQRTACNLGVARERIERGETLVAAGTLAAGRILDVRLRWLATSRADLDRRARVLVHAGTSQTLATVRLLDRRRLEPGESALAQLELERPLVALPGDRFILRGFGLQEEHRTTVGGGLVLRVLAPRRHRALSDYAGELGEAERALADPAGRIEREIRWAGPAGLSSDELAARLPYPPSQLETSIGRLLAARRIVRFDRERGASVHADVLAKEQTRALAAVDGFHAQAPLRRGIAREELRSKLGDAVGLRLFHLIVERLTAAGELVSERDLIRRPTHTAAATEAARILEPLVERLARLYEEAGLASPRAAEAAERLGVPLQAAKEASELLLHAGRLVRVQDLLFSRRAVDEVEARLVAFLHQHSEVTPQEWKEIAGVSRKYSIPLAEYFDSKKLTLRVGEVRRLRR